MKKKFLAVVVSCLILLSLIGCQQTTTDTDNHEIMFDQFVVIETREDLYYGTFYITYDKDTMVEYYITGHRGGISPVYNADGTLKIYPEKLTE